MAKIILVVTAFLSVVGLSTQDEPKCYVPPPQSVTNLQWPDMEEPCISKVKEHIQRELGASVTYIAMAAHFLNSAHFRPGVAKKFLEHAGEERMHAKGLIDYLLLRGEAIDENEIPPIKPLATSWDSVYEALNNTLTIELDVRDYFKKIIFHCEGGDDANHANVDYHISDFLTGNFLDEQHKGVHEISNLLVTLKRMLQNGNSAFAEIEFDRSLLKGE